MAYLEQCTNLIGNFNPLKVENLTMQDCSHGSSTVFAPLGFLELDGGQNGMHVGIKYARAPHARDSEMVGVYLARRIGFLDVVTSQSADLLPNLPAFMGRIVVCGTVYGGILTEDFSCGGKLHVDDDEQYASEAIRAALSNPYRKNQEEVLVEATLRNGLIGVIGGVERLIDLSVLPVEEKYLRGSQTFSDAVREAMSRITDLTVKVSPDSPLGQSLVQAWQE